MPNVSRIRLNSEKGVTHFCTKYYHVVHDESVREDHIKLKTSKDILYRVKAVNQENSTIIYEELPNPLN